MPGTRGRCTPGHLRRAVRGCDAGAAGGDDHVVRRRRRRSQRRLHRLTVGDHLRAVDLEAQLGQRGRRAADRCGPRRRRRPPGWRRSPPAPLMTASAPLASRRSARRSCASTRTSVMRRRRVDRLDHVDQRQAGDGHAGQRLHLDPVRSAVRTVAEIATASSATCSVDVDPVHGDRVAERDQVGRALGRLDAGDPGHRDRVTLGHPAGRAAAAPPRPRRAPARSRSRVRAVTSLPDTSTMRAAPDSSTWVKPLGS